MYKVYRIANIVNHKVYIGVTKKNLTKRLREHFAEAKRERSAHRKLYLEINKIGAENFYIELLKVCNDKEDGYFYERFFIKQFNTAKEGLNESLGGAGKSFLYPEEIVKVFKENRNIKKTAAILSCCTDIVAETIKNCGFKACSTTELLGKRVIGKDLQSGEEKVFLSSGQAGRYCVELGRCKNYSGGTRQKILYACDGRLKSAYGFEWSYA